MKINPEGDVVLTDTEKDIILQGARLLSMYCENLTGCKSCPFNKVKYTDNEGNTAKYCECREYLPCCWTIPEKWQEEGQV